MQEDQERKEYCKWTIACPNGVGEINLVYVIMAWVIDMMGYTSLGFRTTMAEAWWVCSKLNCMYIWDENLEARAVDKDL